MRKRETEKEKEKEKEKERLRLRDPLTARDFLAVKTKRSEKLLLQSIYTVLFCRAEVCMRREYE